MADERVFYCKFDPNIIFTASSNVSKDIEGVRFMSVYMDGVMYGIINSDLIIDFTAETHIISSYVFKDFIEVDKFDPTIWDE